jgi:hypothetical protein
VARLESAARWEMHDRSSALPSQWQSGSGSHCNACLGRAYATRWDRSMWEVECQLLESVRSDSAFLRSMGLVPCLIDRPLPLPYSGRPHIWPRTPTQSGSRRAALHGNQSQRCNFPLISVAMRRPCQEITSLEQVIEAFCHGARGDCRKDGLPCCSPARLPGSDQGQSELLAVALRNSASGHTSMPSSVRKRWSPR